MGIRDVVCFLFIRLRKNKKIYISYVFCYTLFNIEFYCFASESCNRLWNRKTFKLNQGRISMMA